MLTFFKVWILPVLKTWWWLPLPFLLFKPFVSFWLWWRQELTNKKKEYVLLEIKLAKHIIKPIKAMEDVFASFAVIDITPGDFREKWIEGDNKLFPPLSLEIISLGGETHFFARTEKDFRHIVESAIYSQYPDAEIFEAKDYTKFVPRDIPNEKWDIEGKEFVLDKEDCYPIKTYEKFETGTEAKEEKRVDPIAGLLEGFATLKEGEQIWVQILIHKAGKEWIEKGKKERDKLAKRPEKAKPKPMIQEAAEILISGAAPGDKEKKEEAVIPPEMMLTPGEREIVKELEDKISKQGFETNIRVIYLAKREVFFKPHLLIPASFIINFNTQNLNKFKAISETSTRVHSTLLWFMDKRRAFLRKRKMFKSYIRRVRPFFPADKGFCVLNAKELASIFHFPGEMVAPAPFMPRIEAKKGEAPPSLPTE